MVVSSPHTTTTPGGSGGGSPDTVGSGDTQITEIPSRPISTIVPLRSSITKVLTIAGPPVSGPDIAVTTQVIRWSAGMLSAQRGASVGQAGSMAVSRFAVCSRRARIVNAGSIGSSSASTASAVSRGWRSDVPPEMSRLAS